MADLKLEQLKEMLSYNSDSGLFTWKTKVAKKTKIGSIAGCLRKDGYITIRIKGKNYLAHRLAMFYTEGIMPECVDHINRQKSDNRILNLRSVTQLENCRNLPVSKNNTSGCVGVHWCNRDKRWISSISISSKLIRLGNYLEYSDAVNARKNAEVLYGFHENHGKEL